MSAAAQTWPEDGIILYDGVCVLCSGWIRFIARRDAARRFRFTAIQSPYGRALAQAIGIDPDDPDTNAVILDGQVFRRSTAALVILEHLPYWRWVAGFRLFLPVFMRDAVYLLVARNRYRIFGRYSACRLDMPDLAGRIVSEQ
jgi:predicted DCC family thiol-disulfide oxidoreductase YuxK